MILNSSFFSRFERISAIYALYAGQVNSPHVAYVGITSRLRDRLEQHFVKRDSSVTTGKSAVMLNPDYITEIRWWTNEKFDDKHYLQASELMAFDLLNPTLRSHGTHTTEAKKIYDNKKFKDEIQRLLIGKPSGILVLPSCLSTFYLIEKLEAKVLELEKMILNLAHKGQ